MAVRTLNDQVQQLMDSFTIGSSKERMGRLSKAAVRGCYYDIGRNHSWNYLKRRTQINVVAPYGTGTVQNTASTRTLTLTGGTWPAWATLGEILLNRNVYTVQTYVDGNNLILTSDRSPVADVVAGTAYTLVRTRYDLPADFLELRGIVELERLWSVAYLTPEQMLQRTQLWFQPSNSLFYTILGGSNGVMTLQWTPPPSFARTFDIIYQAKPRVPTLRAMQVTGTIAVSAGSSTVTLTGGAWPLNITGCVLRIGTASNLPDSEVGDNPAVEEHVVLSRTSDTVLVLQDNVVTAASGVKYTLDDPIDLEQSSMLTYFDRMCEARILTLHQSDIGKGQDAQRKEIMARMDAMAADSRLVPSALSSTLIVGGLNELMMGMTSTTGGGV